MVGGGRNQRGAEVTFVRLVCHSVNCCGVAGPFTQRHGYLQIAAEVATQGRKLLGLWDMVGPVQQMIP